MVDEIIIIYKVNNNQEIRIFWENFVKNNKNNCKIIYNNKEFELTQYFQYDKEDLIIKLIGIQNITNMSYMFSYCSSLNLLPDISNLNTNNVTNMSCMFGLCCNLIISERIIRKFRINNLSIY